jgi:hypothetical protein
MEFKKALELLEKSKEFRIGKKEYLAHGFTTLDDKMDQSEPWNIGYYDKINDRITTFLVTEDVIDKRENEEIFKEPGSVVEKLDASKVRKDFSESIEIAKELQKKKYKSEVPTKTIVMVQNTKEYGVVWNITMITMQFNTLNIKVDAETGNVVDEKITSLLLYKVE